jgi:hypothetical protein
MIANETFSAIAANAWMQGSVMKPSSVSTEAISVEKMSKIC